MPLTLPEERGRRRGWASASVELCSRNLIGVIVIRIMAIFTCERHQARWVTMIMIAMTTTMMMIINKKEQRSHL